MQPFRYRKPGYIALAVTDIAKSVRFYTEIVGLTLSEPLAGDIAFLTCSEDHHNLMLYRADTPGVRRMAFEMESQRDLELARDHIARRGWFMEDVPADQCASLKQGSTLRFRIPDHSLLFELYAGMERSAQPFQPGVAKIARLGHVIIRCQHREAVLRTLTQELNFLMSDHFGASTTFLRCFPNPYHHSFGVAEGTQDGLHHINFMVTDIDDVGRATNRLRDNGVEIVYGPGRHDISNSVFLYYLDPDKLTVEYSFGMEEFPEIDAREARNLPLRPEILDSWGGRPEPGFGRVGVVVTAD